MSPPSNATSAASRSANAVSSAAWAALTAAILVLRVVLSVVNDASVGLGVVKLALPVIEVMIVFANETF